MNRASVIFVELCVCLAERPGPGRGRASVAVVVPVSHHPSPPLTPVTRPTSEENTALWFRGEENGAGSAEAWEPSQCAQTRE